MNADTFAIGMAIGLPILTAVLVFVVKGDIATLEGSRDELIGLRAFRK